MTKSEIAKFFDKNGPLDKGDNYEPRPSQIKMAEMVHDTLNEGGITLIEAGTGVGKTYAYLIPAMDVSQILDKPIVISTHSKNLQTQIINKDIKFLNTIFPTVQVNKAVGRNNFICLRKFRKVLEETKEQTLLPVLEKIREPNFTGMRTEVEVPDSVWESIQSETDTSLKQKCPHFHQCFYYNAKKQIAKADIIIANHHLVAADLSVREKSNASILPDYDFIIVDEAHEFESSATSFFSDQINENTVNRLIGYYLRKNKEDKYYGHFHSFLDPQSIANVIVRYKAVEEANYQFFNKIKLWLSKPKVEAGTIGIEPDHIDPVFSKILDNEGQTLKTKLGEFISLIGSILSEHEDDQRLDDITVDISGLKNKLTNKHLFIDKFIQCKLDINFQYAYSIEYKNLSKKAQIKLQIIPINIGSTIKKILFDRVQGAVLTSATMAIGKKFDFLKFRIGLDKVTEITEKILPSPFDYEKNAVFAIVDNLPDPSTPDFEPFALDGILKIVQQTGGRTLILCTSYFFLNKVQKTLSQNRIKVLAQDTSNKDLITEEFKRSPHDTTLVGTSSFWQGVDFPGDMLKYVIIPKIPFPVPTDPVLKARSKKLEKQGQNSFFHLSVPEAATQLVQGFGRLIRTKTDTGMVICFDNRLLTKNYSSIFMRSVPPARKVIGSVVEIIKLI